MKVNNQFSSLFIALTVRSFQVTTSKQIKLKRDVFFLAKNASAVNVYSYPVNALSLFTDHLLFKERLSFESL